MKRRNFIIGGILSAGAGAGYFAWTERVSAENAKDIEALYDVICANEHNNIMLNQRVGKSTAIKLLEALIHGRIEEESAYENLGIILDSMPADPCAIRVESKYIRQEIAIDGVMNFLSKAINGKRVTEMPPFSFGRDDLQSGTYRKVKSEIIDVFSRISGHTSPVTSHIPRVSSDFADITCERSVILKLRADAQKIIDAKRQNQK